MITLPMLLNVALCLLLWRTAYALSKQNGGGS